MAEFNGDKAKTALECDLERVARLGIRGASRLPDGIRRKVSADKWACPLRAFCGFNRGGSDGKMVQEQ